MITARTRIQLAIFCLITLLGVSFVGARYAGLGSLFGSDHYTVTAHFATSGGIYQDAEVSYRGVEIGRVGQMKLTSSGVDVDLDIDKKWKDIPSDTLAVVGNRSAVGEQYVELQPRTDNGPYLTDHSQIAQADTRTPLPTEKLLSDVSDTVESVDKGALKTTITSLGQGFGGTGRSLQEILDAGTAFIKTADDNFGTTTALLRDGNTVLRSQVDNQDAIRSFAKNLSLFSGTLAGHNKDLVSLIQSGGASAQELRSFLQENQVNLGELISEALTTGQVINKNLAGLKQVLVVYPYVVEGGFTVVAREPSAGGAYDAHFGLILTNTPVCHAGYQGTHERTPNDRNTVNFNQNAHCSEPATQSNARGAQNAPRAVASYNTSSHRVTWGTPAGNDATPYQAAPASLGADAWKWLYLQPMTTGK
jgi:phospholipid/cholesterol/gamma-HCH transport system substrate-binding protein